MTARRVFVPATGVSLTCLVSSGWLAAAAGAVLAATHDDEGDTEESEYDALCLAATLSLQMLLDDSAPPRRVVVAARADLPAPSGSEPAQVSLAGGIGIDQVDAVHLDEDDAAGDIEALRAQLAGGADPHDTLLDTIEERALLWYDASELPALTRSGEGQDV